MQVKVIKRKFNLGLAIALSATFLILFPGNARAEYYIEESACGEVVAPVTYYYPTCGVSPCCGVVSPCYTEVEIVSNSPRRIGPQMGAGEMVEYIWIDP